MSRLLTNRRLFILLASVILLIVIAGLTLRDKGRSASLPERVVMDVENTVSGWIYRPVSAATSFLGGIHSLQEMYDENARLKFELKNYNFVQTQLKDLQMQNARLSKMAGYKNIMASNIQWVASAHVVGRDPSAWNSGVTIDVGQKQGVTNNMAVLSEDGSLVGRVAEAAENSSKVVLVTDTQAGDGVSARIQNGKPDEPFGIVVGSTTSPGELEMNFLSPIAQLSVGQTVVTSELSDIYPRGLLIGTVVKVQAGLPGLTQTALIEPSANLDYLQNVFVVAKAGAGK